MMNITAIDVGSEVCSVCIMGIKGKILREENIPMKISEIKKLIKDVPRPRQVVFEEGTHAAWLYSELESVSDDILVCDPRKSSKMTGQFKSDKNDARNLGHLAHGGLLKPVWHGGKDLQALREAVRAYQNLTEESTRLKNQIKAVFRSRGISVGDKAYKIVSRGEVVKKLGNQVRVERVNSLGEVLDIVSEKRSKALKTMVKEARKNKMYKALRKIDGVGPVFSSMLASEIGDPKRFRTRDQLWSYAGLAVSTYESSQFELKHDQIVRKTRAVKTRGLVWSYNRTLKYVFKQAAKTLSRTKWKEYYAKILKSSKNENNALLTLARKHASVVLHIAKTGEKYDITKVFKAQQVSL